MLSLNLISHGQLQITAACKIGHMTALADLDTCCSPGQFVDELHRQNQQAQILVGNLSDAALNWQPNGGKSWSICQCLEHLATTNTLYEGAMRDAIERNEGHVLPGSGVYRPAGWPSRKFIQSMEPPPTRKFRAFRKIIPKASGYRAEEALSRFLRAQQRLNEFVFQSREMDLGSIRFRNPFLKGVRLTVSSGLLLIGAHNRRHLWQAETVRKSAEFPGP